MLDWFLILAPVLLLPTVGLLRFVGCNLVFKATPAEEVEGNAMNCGGPTVFEGGVRYQKDDGSSGTEGDFATSEGGQPVKLTSAVVLDASGNPASELYATGRVGTNLKYTFSSLAPGGYVCTLGFAEIAGAVNAGQRVFEVFLNGSTAGAYDIAALAGGAMISRDEDFLAKVIDSQIVVELAGLQGTDALVNAIQVAKRDAVVIAPSRMTIFAGASQPFQATTNFDDATFDWALIPASPPGQLTVAGASSMYTAPGGVTTPLQETITVEATAGASNAQAFSLVSIYSRIDRTTRGAWLNRYGLDGFVLANTTPDSRLPFYVAQFNVRLTDGTPLNVANLGIPANDPRVLVDPNGNPRPALVLNDLNGGHGITISFTIADLDSHLFGVYCLDNGPDRRQRFTVTQLDNGTSETVDSVIGNGTYLFWIGKGRIQIDVSKVPGSIGVNNVLNAIFFR